MTLKDRIITRISGLRHPIKRKLIGYCSKFENQKGLEIGGPSAIFSLKGYLPVYLFAREIDGINFSNNTVWEGKISEGRNYRCHKELGFQFIREAVELWGIADESYDFILSSHSLEHTANPLKALKEWLRVLKPGGYLVLVLPDKDYTFDSGRSYTTMDHLLKDYTADTGEDDTTHFSEMLALHEGGNLQNINRKELEKKLSENLETRQLHHHVFSLELINTIFQFYGLRNIVQQKAPPFHLINIAQKPLA